MVYRTRNVPGVPRGIVTSSEVVFRLMAPVARARACESLWAVMLDARQHIVAVHEVARGGLAAVHVEAADVFRAAIVCGASAIVLVHNHPSGNPEPGGDDIAITERLVAAGALLGVAVLDHVIIGADSFSSMLDAGIVRFGGRK